MSTQEDHDVILAQQEEEKIEEEVEDNEEETNLEEDPSEIDIDEVAPRIEVEELLAEHEMLEQEFEEFLPPDTILTSEEEGTEVEDFDEDIDDNSADTICIGQDTLVLEAKFEVQEAEDEELETYELIETEQEIQDEEPDSSDQQEVDISLGNDICGEVEEDSSILEEDQEIEFSNINQNIEELPIEVEEAELEIHQLEEELEEELITE
ncbi:MAG: hypothetical protein ACFFB5_21675 [Promethearchaeota archaeon]